MTKQNLNSILISIVTYKAEDYVKKCLNSLVWTNHYKNISISVVDNSPTTSIEKIVNNSNLNISYQFTGENLGFGKGHNLALRKYNNQHGHEPEYIVLVNPDLTIKEKAFRILLTTLEEDPSVAIAGPRLVSEDGKQEKSVFTDPNAFNYLSGFISNTLFPKRNKQIGLINIKKSQYVKGITGACMFIRYKYLESNMIFDPDYFMYFEDLDLCTRIIRKGHNIKYVNEAKSFHKKGASTEKKEDRIQWLKKNIFQSLVLYFKKNKNPLNLFILWFTLSVIFNIKILFGIDKKASTETYRSIREILLKKR